MGAHPRPATRTWSCRAPSGRLLTGDTRAEVITLAFNSSSHPRCCRSPFPPRRALGLEGGSWKVEAV